MAKEEEPTEEEETTTEEDTSLRDDLEAALTEDENATEETAEEETATEKSADEEEPTKDKESGEQQSKDVVGDGEGEATPSGINAPIGFSPESREKWADVPDVVKAEIQRREAEITEAMANTGEYRRTHTALEGLAQSYAPILAAEGVDTPMQAIEGLFRTVAELRVGSPQQVATKMAQMIGHYGVDITMLDQALSGQPVQTEEMTAMERMLDSRLAPIQNYMQSQGATQAQQTQASQQAVNTELQEFAKSAEFLNDVRNDMADLIDLASKQGRKMDFKEAYDKSCAMHPTISKILSERTTNETLKNNGEKVADKRNASSSLASSGGTGKVKSKADMSLREGLEDLWDEAES